jgi:RNA polymerase sigma-70 factor (ECF subfamily)
MARQARTAHFLAPLSCAERAIYIVPGAEPARTPEIARGGTRVHLEIDIDTEFEAVDADALGRIVMEVCRLSGGQPIRIICVKKGSLRVTISFMCGNLADAEDIVQESFLRATRHGIPRGVRNVDAWMTTLVKKVFVDHCRNMKRAPSHESITGHQDDLAQLEADGPDTEWSEITLDDIREALDAIEPVYREVYRLHMFEDRSYEQIARQLGIPRVAVGSRLNRARKKLRQILVARLDLRSKP